MATNELVREEWLAQRLAQYDAALAAETPPEELDTQPPADDAELAAEWLEAKACLELLDRVRRRWSPDDVSGETLAWQHEALATPSDQRPMKLGRFRILHKLGQGGLGIVYLAYDPKLARQVALKVPRAESLTSSDLRWRFLREAEAAARLNHPHVVTVHDAGEEGLICYIASEYCPGPNLSLWLKERGQPVPITLAARIAMQLAEAVQHAHGRGVLHRDIKPSNVLLAPYGSAADGIAVPNAQAEPTGDALRTRSKVRAEAGEVVPKLTDFGMAKLLEHEADETRSGALIGTPAYMAPEQADGRVRDLDARTDVYGLGAVLYELLTGHRPHEGTSEVDVLRRVIFEEPIPPQHLRVEIPLDLEAICLKCLSKNRAGRYPTAQALADDLARFLEGRPTFARPSGALERTWKWARRRPALAAMSGLSAAALVIVMSVVVGFNYRLTGEIQRADFERDRARREAEASQRLLYSADVRLAYDAYQANDLPQTIDLLERHVPAPGEPDLREFAWHYLHDKCSDQSLTLRGHIGDVYSVEYSPDGHELATAGMDGTARLWDAATGALKNTLRGHQGEINYARFDPAGRLLATAGEDGTVRLWSLPGGEELGVLSGHADQVLAIAFAPDGKRLSSGGGDGSVRVWNVETYEIERSINATDEVVTSLAYSPDGTILVTGDNADRIRCWRTHDWHELPGANVPDEDFTALAFSPDQHWLAGGGVRSAVRFWDWSDKGLRTSGVLSDAHAGRIQALAFSPLDSTLATAGNDGLVTLWSVGRWSSEHTVLGHTDRAWSLAWSPDGRRLATAGRDSVVHIWDTWRTFYDTWRYPDVPCRIEAMAVVPNGKQIVIGSNDGVVRIWDANNQRLIARHQLHDDSIIRLCLSPEGAFVATRGHDGATMVASLDTGQVLFTFRATSASPMALDWSPIGNMLATSIDDRTMAIVDATTGQLVRRIEHESMVRRVSYSPDARQLATSSDCLRLWDTATGELQFKGVASDELAYAPDGALLATSLRGDVTLLDRHSGEVQRRIVLRARDITDLDFSPDCRTLACATGHTIVLCDVRTGQQFAELDAGREVNALKFSSAGDRLIAVCNTAELGGIASWRLYVPQSANSPDEAPLEDRVSKSVPLEEAISVYRQPELLVRFTPPDHPTTSLRGLRVGYLSSEHNQSGLQSTEELQTGEVQNRRGWGESVVLQPTIRFGERRPIDRRSLPIDAIDVGDLDQDGDLDIVIKRRTDTQLSVYTNDGRGEFIGLYDSELAKGGSTLGIHLAHLDSDDALDMLLARSSRGVVEWCKNVGGTSMFAPANTLASDLSMPINLVAADLDGDGDQDAICTDSTSNSVVVLDNLGAGRFAQPQRIVNRFRNVSAVTAADLDADGDIDLVATSEDDDKVAWFTNDGQGRFGAEQVVGAADGANAVAVADLDGDGDLDVLASAAAEGALAWFANDGTAHFGAPLWLSRSLHQTDNIDLADLDSDGDTDVLVADYGANVVYCFVNDGLGTFHQSQRVVGQVVPYASQVKAADLNGDGMLDVVIGGRSFSWSPGEGNYFDVITDYEATDPSSKFSTHSGVLPIPNYTRESTRRGRITQDGIQLLFESIEGMPLSSDAVGKLVGGVTVYRDSNHNGAIDANEDELLATETDLSLSNGVATISLASPKIAVVRSSASHVSRPVAFGETDCCNLIRAINAWAADRGHVGGYPTFERVEVDGLACYRAVLLSSHVAKRVLLPLAVLRQFDAAPLSDYTNKQTLFSDVARRVNEFAQIKGFISAMPTCRLVSDPQGTPVALEVLLVKSTGTNAIDYRLPELDYPDSVEALFRAVHLRAIQDQHHSGNPGFPTFAGEGDVVRCVRLSKAFTQVVDIPAAELRLDLPGLHAVE